MRFILTLAECPYRIVARRSAGVAGLRDLRGKRVGTQLESSAQFFVDQMLRTVGLTDEDVRIEHFMAHTARPVSSLPEALAGGEIDAVALWEPQVQRAKRLLGADAIEFFDPAVYTEKFNLCTKQANLDNPALRTEMVAFVQAVIEAGARLRQEPEHGQRLIAKTAGLSIETVRDAWHCFSYPGYLAPDLLDVFTRQEPWIAKLQGRAARSVEALSKLIDDSVVREAKRSP